MFMMSGSSVSVGTGLATEPLGGDPGIGNGLSGPPTAS